MTEKNSTEIIEEANRVIKEASEPPMTVQEFVQDLIDDPMLGRSSHQYLLDAIEYYGTRIVLERGKEKERYKFFDDPANDGEHAVLGNTSVLNRFVEDLRVIVNGEERMQKIVLFNGPTATGKSELKRCIVNGLREYSKTNEGKRYTCEWNSGNFSGNRDMAYGDMPSDNFSTNIWNRSPVQANPISVLPSEVREEIARSIQEYEVATDVNLDPFSQKEYNIIKDYYEDQRPEDLFTAIVDSEHVRIRRYTVDETQGIGILNAEDDGSVKERLLGSWMPSMLRELDSVGEKDPRAFSYDGVISQGNGGVSVVEDATKHADILVHLLNVPDEGHAKIDKEIGFDVDTVPIFISNPDLVSQQLEEMAGKQIPLEEAHGVDPLKAIKRRIFQYEIRYLTSVSDEALLVRKEVNGFTNNLRIGDVDPADPLRSAGTEFAPRTIEGIALYNVVTRLSEDNLPSELNLVDKALLYDRGFIETDNGRKNIADLEMEESDSDGKFGVPVTYSRDILSGLIHSSEEDVYLPQDVLESVVEGLSTAPVFADNEVDQFEQRANQVLDHIDQMQQQDVIEAILHDRQATEEAVTEYVDNLYAWENESENEYDEYLLKDFEKRHLGTVEGDYNGQQPSSEVETMRTERIIRPLNRYHWRQRDEEFGAADMNLTEVPVLSSILGEYSWIDVFTAHPNLDTMQWENPPENTQTEQIKQKCIREMVNTHDYSEQSARLTSERVFSENRDDLQEIKKKVVDE